MQMGRVAIGVMGAFCLLWRTAVGVGATVSVSASAGTVAEGASLTLTCTVTPSTYVTQVVFSYEDGSSSDTVTSAPYQVAHAFNTPMDALTVTATVAYSNGDPNDQATTDVNVVGLSLSGSTAPRRASTVAYAARSNPVGKAISQFNWTYTAEGVTNSYTDYDTDNDDISYWSGKMVISGTLTVQATISGVACTKQVAVTVQPRTGWTLPISCAQDNNAVWGDEPTESQPLGMYRDRDSDEVGRLFVPQPTDGDFSSAVTLTRVSSGPCLDWWYVGASTLKCQRETVINQYIKYGGPAPQGSSDNFFDHNDTYCLYGDAADFVQAVMNHEYRGTPDTARSENGHHGRTENGVADAEIAGDPKVAIESLAARSSANLQSLVDVTVESTETNLGSYALDESWSVSGPNWGAGANALGSGLHACWISFGLGWTDCNSEPEDF
jgi:hypothetical protein